MISFRLDVERKERKERDPGSGRECLLRIEKFFFLVASFRRRNCRGSLEIVYLAIENNLENWSTMTAENLFPQTLQ